MLIVHIPQLPVLEQRAKVSHSWLDHEIAMVDSDLAVARWSSGTWSLIGMRWQNLHQIAEDFADMMEHFSASGLVDERIEFRTLAPATATALKRILDSLHSQHMDAAAVRKEYLDRLARLWTASQTFFARLDDQNCTEPAVRSSWQDVRDAGAAMKLLFSDGTIPAGIVLP